MNLQLIRKSYLFNRIKKTRLYRIYNYKRLKIVSKKELLREATTEFKNNRFNYGGLKDYKKCLKKYLCSFSEYMFQYEFWKLDKKQKYEYVSRLEMRLYYERHVPEDVRLLFWNKKNWLLYFKDYIHRSWISTGAVDWITFNEFIDPNKYYIAKPEEGSLGHGIFKFNKNDINEELYYKLLQDNYIVEECVENEYSIAEFHPFSLNTIRVTTLSNGEIIGAFVRFGNNGNIVDNAHAGGIFSMIDVDKGEIVTDGVDVYGHTYKYHPYSNIEFKGFIIPCWREIILIVREMHKMIPQAPVVGWDICITRSNEIEVIEGNHFPDIDVLQSPFKKGIRKQLEYQLKVAKLPSLNK